MNKTWKLCPFGEKAENIRKERGITKAELCRRLGISVTYYDFITHGLRPGLKQQKRIIDMLTKSEVKEAS